MLQAEPFAIFLALGDKDNRPASRCAATDCVTPGQLVGFICDFHGFSP
jgi:hypothetical protein